MIVRPTDVSNTVKFNVTNFEKGFMLSQAQLKKSLGLAYKHYITLVHYFVNFQQINKIYFVVFPLCKSVYLIFGICKFDFEWSINYFKIEWCQYFEYLECIFRKIRRIFKFSLRNVGMDTFHDFIIIKLDFFNWKTPVNVHGFNLV